MSLKMGDGGEVPTSSSSSSSSSSLLLIGFGTESISAKERESDEVCAGARVGFLGLGFL